MIRLFLWVIAVYALTGCNLRPDIVSAHAVRNANSVTVEVVIPTRDAVKIKRRQLYVHIAVTDCDGSDLFYAIDPSVNGDRVAEFRFATVGDTTKLSGDIPAVVLEKFQRPCVSLRGGGYFTGRLKVRPIPIDTEVASGSVSDRP
ncbi:hypothetical protein ACW5EG_14550 [Luteimonas sp. A611]